MKNIEWYNDISNDLNNKISELKRHYPAQAVTHSPEKFYAPEFDNIYSSTFDRFNPLHYKGKYQNIHKRYSYKSKKIDNKELDELEQYIQMYIEVLPFVFDKDIKFSLKDIHSFEEWKTRYNRGFYQQRMFQAEVIEFGQKETFVVKINCEVKEDELSDGYIMFFPILPKKASIIRSLTCIYFSGQRINIIEN